MSQPARPDGLSPVSRRGPSTTARSVIAPIAVSVSGALRSVSTAKIRARSRSPRFRPERLRRRHPCSISADSRRARRAGRRRASRHFRPRRSREGRRSFASTSARVAVTSSPPCLPSRDCRPSRGGNCPISASESVRLAEPNSVPFVAPAVAISAATAISVKPASPSVGLAASAIAVSPNSLAWSTLNVPKTPIAISTYVAVVNPSARATALGSSRLGSRRFGDRERHHAEADRSSRASATPGCPPTHPLPTKRTQRYLTTA